MTYRKTLVSLALALGALATGAAQARGNVDVQLNIGLPGLHLRLPVPPLPPLPVIVVNQPARGVVVQPGRGYGDRDRDGIPDRYDRVYNPRWDRDGDGIPNRYDHRYNPRGDRDHDGVPNRWDRHDNRPDPRGPDGGRGDDDRGDRGRRH